MVFLRNLTSSSGLSIGRDEWYTKRKGEIAELIFVIKASSMGFAVSKPYGDSEAYDLVIEDDGKLLRIQVKSAFTTSRWGYSVAVARNRLGRRASGIRRRRSISLWLTLCLMMPGISCRWRRLRGGRMFGFILRGLRKRDGGYFERYREAWELLRVVSSK